jgi:hypothetical protein
MGNFSNNATNRKNKHSSRNVGPSLNKQGRSGVGMRCRESGSDDQRYTPDIATCTTWENCAVLGTVATGSSPPVSLHSSHLFCSFFSCLASFFIFLSIFVLLPFHFSSFLFSVLLFPSFSFTFTPLLARTSLFLIFPLFLFLLLFSIFYFLFHSLSYLV